MTVKIDLSKNPDESVSENSTPADHLQMDSEASYGTQNYTISK